jgi:hypothetical protein
MADRGHRPENRRTRIDPSVDPQLRAWLHATTRIHAGLCALVRLYGQPHRAGGAGVAGDCYADRLAAGDPSLLFDALGVAADQITDLRDQIGAWMDSAPSTTAPPGSPGKVQAMVDRAALGHSLFIAGDAASNVE